MCTAAPLSINASVKINRDIEPVFSWKNEIDPLVDMVYNGLNKRRSNE